MKKFVIMMGLFLMVSVAKAQEIGVFNVNAFGTYVYVALDAGTYDFTLTCPDLDGRAEYFSWSPWRNDPWDKWSTMYVINANGGGYNGGAWGWGYGYSPESGFYGLSIPERTLTLDIEYSQTVSMYVGDSVYSDNGGGVSVMITQVPEPATMGLLVLGCIGLIRRRRRK
ncbi:MAG: PEP-CTERM sorting domain-containing protein [Phycisphaerae bacterium]|nr:PEP-CTERM sorting domain-containing protein [Phycisphaerae bacterium]